MRQAARALVAAFLMTAAMLGAAGAASADPFSTPSTDPASNDYNPRSWLLAWDPVAEVDTFQATAEGDMHAGMDKTGMTVASQPAHWSSLTAADRTQLTTAWEDDLLLKTYSRTQRMFQDVNNNDFTAIPWAAADSDSVARDLGASSYSALSPGLKSVVQRIATIVTGEYKPAMPDDAWASWMPADVRAAFDARPDNVFDYRRATVSSGVPPSGITTQCDAGVINWACEATRAVAGAAGEVAGAVGTAVTWATDPLGKLAGLMAEGSANLMSWVATEASEATAPDLSGDWWINAYTVGMAVGIVLLGFVLLWQLIQKARGAIDSRDLVESFVVWGPAYFAGIVFGPPLAQFMIIGSSALTDGIAQALTGYSAADAATEINAALEGAAAGTVVGGMITSFFILLVMALSAFMIFISLCAQTVAVYLSSAVFAVAFAWVVSSRQRGGSMKIPLLFMGLVFSRPLLFFLLGAGLGFSRQIITFDDEPAKNLATLVMAAFILVIAGFAPLLLLKYAPISPTGMGAAGGGGNGVAAAGIGAAAAAGGNKLAGLANTRAAQRAAKSAGSAAAGGARAGSTTQLTGGGAGVGGAATSAASAGAGSTGAGSTGAGSAMSRSAKPGSVAQRLNRAPRSAGGIPSARAASLGSKVPSTGGAASGSASAAAAGTSARSVAPAPAGPAAPRPGGARPAPSSPAARRRSAPPTRPAGGHLPAAARDLTDGLDGDQKWESR